MKAGRDRRGYQYSGLLVAVGVRVYFAARAKNGTR